MKREHFLNLRKKIAEKTASLKFSWYQTVSRVFYVVVSPEMRYLKDWFCEWFPILDDDLKKIYPWIVLNSETDLSHAVADAWDKAFDMGTLTSLTTKGFDLLDTANQIIFIGDLTEEDFLNKLKSIYESFKGLMELKAVQVPLYRIGLFLLRRKEKGEKGEIVRNPHNFEKFKNWAPKHFDKLFFIDISNMSGVFVAEQKDLYFLLGQLVYILTKKPLELKSNGKTSNFGEWLKRDDPTERFTGFSAISALIPIDYILESILIRKSGEVLQEVFFKDSSAGTNRVSGYLNLLLSDADLTCPETSLELLRNNPKYPLIAPLKTLVGWDINHPENFLASTSDLIAKLPDYVQENEKQMRRTKEELFINFKNKLADRIKEILSKEQGGLKIAEIVLDKFRKYLENLNKKLQNNPPKSGLSDPSPLIKELESKVKKGPTREAVITRSLLMSITVLLVISSAKTIFGTSYILFSLGFLLTIGVGLFYWYSWKSKIEEQIIRIREALNKNWEILMKEKSCEILKELISKYTELTQDMTTKISDISGRLKTIIDYSKSKHKPPLPEDSAFWTYVIKDIEELKELEDYSDLIDIDIKTISSECFLCENSMEHWKKVFSSELLDYTSWEWEFLEKAALQLLPYTQKILELSVCKILRESCEKMENFIQLFVLSSSPFVSLEAGVSASTIDIKGILEVYKDECGDILSKIKDELIRNIPSISSVDSHSPYRISFFSFAEGIELKSINLGG